MQAWVLRSTMFVGLLLSVLLVRAQDSASMTGVVRDVTGAVVPGTTVVLSNGRTGLKFTQTTNTEGAYVFANVPPSQTYAVTFTHAGFTAVTLQNIALQVGITRTQDAQLQVGAENEKVEVSGASSAVTLNTTDASIGNNLDPQVLNDLPVQDRTAGISTLFYLQPGVDISTGAVTGARTDQSEVTVDGMDVNDIAAGTTFAIVANAPVDSVDQFRGVVGGLVPSVGTGSGGQFQLVTKSGTNQFHGNINEYNRNTDTEANSFFNNLVGVPRVSLVRNQFGGSVGGPILKDKLFFFGDVAVSRIATSTPEERTVPLSGFRSGTLNYILANDASGNACPDSSRLDNNPACIGTLSSAKVTALDPAGIGFDSAVLAAINARYPQANDVTQGDGVNTGGFRFNAPTPDNEITSVGRIDYNLTQTQRIFGRFTIAHENAIYTPVKFPGDPVTQPYTDRSYGYVVSHIWTIGSTKVNQFYYGDTVSEYGYPFTYNPMGANQVSFTGITSPYVTTSGQRRRVPIPEVRDDFNWQKGKHNLTFGGTFKFIKTDSELLYNFNFIDAGLQGSQLYGGLDPSVRPVNIGTGQNATNDYDQMFTTGLGVIGEVYSNFDYNATGSPYPQGSGSTRNYRYFESELYAGDTWKITQHLTLDYGLRYQLYTVPYETHGEESVPYFTGLSPQKSTFNTYIADRVAQSTAGNVGNAAVPILSYEPGGKANNGPNMYQPSYKDFAPRVAIAYNPAFLPRTVFNAGAGIVYDRTVINAINFIQDQSSYLYQANNANQFGSSAGAGPSLASDPRLGANFQPPSGLTPPAPAITRPFVPYVDSTGTPYGLAEGSAFNYAVDPQLKDPYSITMNAGVQQEMPGHMILGINYAGRLGRRLIAQADGSQLIDFPDKASGQLMSQAFAGLTQQERNGASFSNLAPEPWFEDVVQPGMGQAFGFPNNTSLVGYLASQLGIRGDFADTIQELALYTYYYGYPFLPTNAGMAAQFSGNTYITNMGFSSYNGLLVNLAKNVTHGLQFNVNYTWSHSIDNTSQPANSISSGSGYGFICDVVRPRECRASSDFDVANEINSNFEYALPFGRGREFLGRTPRWLDEVVGGWKVSGIPYYRSGRAVNVFSDAFVAGYANNAPAIYTGNPGNKPRTHVNISNSTVYMFNGGQAGADKVLSEFTGPLGFEVGPRNFLRGPGLFSMDMGVAKSFPIIEDKLRLDFRADAFNVLNHTVFSTPSNSNQPLNIVTNASPFGQITATPTGTSVGSPRVLQVSGRIEF